MNNSKVTVYTAHNVRPIGPRRSGTLYGMLWLSLLTGTHMLVVLVPVASAEGADRVEWFGGAPSDRWVYGVELYLWAASVGGETAGGDDIDISFNDIERGTKVGFMGTLAAARDKWTLFADLIYLVRDIGNRGRRGGGGGGGRGRGRRRGRGRGGGGGGIQRNTKEGQTATALLGLTRLPV